MSPLLGARLLSDTQHSAVAGAGHWPGDRSCPSVSTALLSWPLAVPRTDLAALGLLALSTGTCWLPTKGGKIRALLSSCCWSASFRKWHDTHAWCCGQHGRGTGAPFAGRAAAAFLTLPHHRDELGIQYLPLRLMAEDDTGFGKGFVPDSWDAKKSDLVCYAGPGAGGPSYLCATCVSSLLGHWHSRSNTIV